MFYQPQTIHYADSPRQLNALAWLTNKSLRTQNTHLSNTSKDLQTIDLREHYDQIAQGFIQLGLYQYDSDKYLHFTYKLPAGIYTQYGFKGGSIDIPLPEIIISGKLKLRYTNDGIKTSTIRLRIGSPYLYFLPITNMHFYETHSDLPSWIIKEANGQKIHYYKLCDNNVLDQQLGTNPTVIDLVNKIDLMIQPFLFLHGNSDLDLCDRRHPENELSAWLIVREINNSSHYANFRLYWCFLNLASQTHTPEEIYENMLAASSVSNLFQRLNLTEKEIIDFRNQYQSDNNPNRLY